MKLYRNTICTLQSCFATQDSRFLLVVSLIIKKEKKKTRKNENIFSTLMVGVLFSIFHFLFYVGCKSSKIPAIFTEYYYYPSLDVGKFRKYAGDFRPNYWHLMCRVFLVFIWNKIWFGRLEMHAQFTQGVHHRELYLTVKNTNVVERNTVV